MDQLLTIDKHLNLCSRVFHLLNDAVHKFMHSNYSSNSHTNTSVQQGDMQSKGTFLTKDRRRPLVDRSKIKETPAKQELPRSLSDALRGTDTGKVFQGKMSGSSN